jgi:sulfur-carrier protein adenylyltransferase/sulfurtransferase
VEICSRYDVILDGSDNFATRYLVNDAAVRADRPVVYGAIHRYEGQFAVFNYEGGPTYRCLYPNPPDDAQAPSCSEAGVLGVAAGLVGVQMAWQAIALLLGRVPSAAGVLTLFDLQSGRTTRLNILRRENSVARSRRGSLGESDRYAGPTTVCSTPDDLELSAHELVRLKAEGSATVIDVREPGEQGFGPAIEAARIPASMLPARADLVPRDDLVVLCCDTGGRSLAAASRLRSVGGFDHVKSLRGGLLALEAVREHRSTGV